VQEGFVLNMAGFRHVVSNAIATAIDDGPTLRRCCSTRF
jgi:hypothetical protein